eukprot:4887405-Pleurochrysis_carterae.AAC.1
MRSLWIKMRGAHVLNEIFAQLRPIGIRERAQGRQNRTLLHTHTYAAPLHTRTHVRERGDEKAKEQGRDLGSTAPAR